MNTTIHYNKSKKQWLASNGPVTATFPAGPAGKARAQMYALEHDCPVVYEEVCAIIENTRLSPEASAIEKRALNAGLLVRDGHVLPADERGYWGDQLNAFAVVKSQSDSLKRYHIYQGWSDDLSCTCEDFGYRAPWLPSGQRACKHILAYQIACTIAEIENEVELAFEKAELEENRVKA